MKTQKKLKKNPLEPLTKNEKEQIKKAVSPYVKPTKEQVTDKQIDELQKQIIRLEMRVEELEKDKNVITVNIEQERQYPSKYYYYNKPYEYKAPQESPWPNQIWCNLGAKSSDKLFGGDINEG